MLGKVGPGLGLGRAQRGSTFGSAVSQWESFQTVVRRGDLGDGLGRVCFGLGSQASPQGWAGQCWTWGISSAHGENPDFKAHGLLRLAVPAHLIMWGQLDVDPDALPCPSANLSCLSKQGWQAEGHLSFACMDSPQDHFPAPALFFGST